MSDLGAKKSGVAKNDGLAKKICWRARCTKVAHVIGRSQKFRERFSDISCSLARNQ